MHQEIVEMTCLTETASFPVGSFIGTSRSIVRRSIEKHSTFD